MLPAIIATIQPASATGGVPLWASGIMVVLGAGLLAMVILHLRSTRSHAAPRPKPTKAAPATGPTPQLARELDELGKRLADELDARADRIERLLAEADEKLARLERLTAATVQPAPESAGPLTEVKHFTAGAAGDAATSAAPTLPPGPRSAAAVMAEIDPLAGEVYKLADSGLPPVQIAQKLSQHTGKIELLLALRRG